MQKNYTVLLVLGLFFGLVAPETIQAQSNQSQNIIASVKGKKIDDLLKAYKSEGLLNGSVLVAERGKLIYTGGFGYANFEFKVPNESNTKFRIASLSKPIVAALTMRLVQQGKLSLDAKVSDYLPDYRKDVAEKVTVRHLLTHTSGIPDTLVRPGMGEREVRDPFTPQDLLARYSNGTLEFEPGTKVKYGTMAFVLLSLMIEKATGKTFEQAMHDEVFEPLGMHDSGMESTSPTAVPNERGRLALKGESPVIERLATGYFKIGNGFGRTPFMDMTHAYAGGSIYSTVEDLFRFDRGLYDDKFISKQLREMMFTSVLEDKALGWDVRHISFADLQQPFLNIIDPPALPIAKSADFKLVSKVGDLWGYSGVFSRLVDDEHAIIVLVNRNNRALYFDLDTIRITQGLMNILYDKPYFTPREQMFIRIIERNGFGKAVETFKRLKQKELSSPIIREAEFNILGYEFLNRKQFNQAIAMFKLNVEAHPNSANVYDSLGEAYMKAGIKELAITNYKKSLELNPQNKDAAEKLIQLQKQ